MVGRRERGIALERFGTARPVFRIGRMKSTPHAKLG
jgi:hypothetical protein